MMRMRHLEGPESRTDKQRLREPLTDELGVEITRRLQIQAGEVGDGGPRQRSGQSPRQTQIRRGTETQQSQVRKREDSRLDVGRGPEKRMDGVSRQGPQTAQAK